ncbi:hypothetical protein [Actinomyces naeslundii]|uniref:hypothetical protein n=1 Tax=Actinomyces naeslundii TaxID=1655 RepID=UPI00117803D4|nr:hypothetical protein [Actinomyces naeslundii]
MMAGDMGTWQPVGIDSALERGPNNIPAVPHRGGHLELLPFECLNWQDFESLQWRILRDVEGMRHAQFYGDPGQAQLGLDIVAVAADDSGVALQSKRVKQFGPAEISAAVEVFQKTTRPFDVSRFILGVSREVRTTKVIDRFKELQKELAPIQFELWDQRELSHKLKRAPEIVIDYFGKDIAEIFCEPFKIVPRVIPDRDVVALRQAIARTPEETTGVSEKITQAKAQIAVDPEAALALVIEAQDTLIEAGFAGHAAQHEALHASLLVAVGRGTEATRRRLDQLWLALDRGHTTLADIAKHDINKLAEQVDSKAVRDHQMVAKQAVHLYSNPLGAVPALDDLLVEDVLDRARLATLAGETALTVGNHEWLKESAHRIRSLADEVPADAQNDTLRVRLRILAAEGSGVWNPVLGDARALKLGYDLGALVQARYARYLAFNQKFAEADASWDEAVGNACHAQRWGDASRWVFCRRAFRGRWQPFTADELLPVQTALSARGSGPTVVTRDENALEYAYSRLADNKLRPAAIAAQRALRDAVIMSDWEGERRARRLLADVLSASGEHLMAAKHLVLAGEIDALKRLGTDQTIQFLDVTSYLNAKPWWIAGAAYRLITVQADLVPDDLVSVIAGHALADLEAAKKGSLVDLSAFTGSRYLGAIAALAGVSERLTDEQAEKLLTYFEDQPPVEPNHYRYYDEDEARAVAGILTTHPELSHRALTHLVGLLSRSESSRTSQTQEAITDRIAQARPLLQELAEADNIWARELLESEEPEKASVAQIQEARARLEEPLVHTPCVLTIGSGSGSVSDSALVRILPACHQEAALGQLLERGSDRNVSALDRASYLIAASNLRPPTSRGKRVEFLDRALALVLSPPESVADALDASFSHPLGAVRINRRLDTRGEAAHLAATLARTRQDKERVRTAVFGLIGDESVSELWVARALERLGDTMAPDVGFLSGQNWALRSFSAILWSKTTEPEPVGCRLAADTDVRVRRVLARYLVQNQDDEDAGILILSSSGASAAARRRDARAAVLSLLLEDPCFSVRAAATATKSTALTVSK